MLGSERGHFMRNFLVPRRFMRESRDIICMEHSPSGWMCTRHELPRAWTMCLRECVERMRDCFGSPESFKGGGGLSRKSLKVTEIIHSVFRHI